MRIIFLCGSLEPGRDGVGDYTRRLAGELIRQDHQVALIALNDRQLNEDVLESTQPDGEYHVHTLRLSNRLPWASRTSQANAYIRNVNPEWISLQYVPFSFHDKGLHIGLSKILKRISGGRKVQIMFHELWVGMYIQAPAYHVWWGQFQRYLIQLLVTRLKPDVMHTHALLYHVQLNKLGFQASLLPLFTNIPLGKGRVLKTATQIAKKSASLGFVLFGGIHPGSPASQLAEEVAVYAKQQRIDIDLTIVGRAGLEQEVWATAWRSNGLTVHVLGEQSQENISTILSQASIGLSTTPASLSGKSSAIAVMHAHGLPVLCVTMPWHPRGINELISSPGIFEYTVGNFKSFMSTYSTMYLPTVTIATIGRQFVDSLGHSHG